jgi:hypothetical protein
MLLVLDEQGEFSEKVIHQKFLNSFHRNEWFFETDEIRQFVEVNNHLCLIEALKDLAAHQAIKLWNDRKVPCHHVMRERMESARARLKLDA